MRVPFRSHALNPQNAANPNEIILPTIAAKLQCNSVMRAASDEYLHNCACTALLSDWSIPLQVVKLYLIDCATS